MEDRGAGGGGGLDSLIVNLSGYVRSALMRAQSRYLMVSAHSSLFESYVCRSLESTRGFSEWVMNCRVSERSKIFLGTSRGAESFISRKRTPTQNSLSFPLLLRAFVTHPAW